MAYLAIIATLLALVMILASLLARVWLKVKQLQNERDTLQRFIDAEAACPTRDHEAISETTPTHGHNALAPNGAASRVLGISELLEAILLQVDTSDLMLRVPLVCKAFHTASCGSLAIQKALFRIPDQKAKVVPFSVTVKGLSMVCTALVRFALESTSSSLAALIAGQSQKGTPVSWDIYTPQLSADVRKNVDLRHIFLTQPPLKHIYVRSRVLPAHIEVSAHTGITYGHLFDAMETIDKQRTKPIFGRGGVRVVSRPLWTVVGWW
jgi:hypothetical protein